MERRERVFVSCVYTRAGEERREVAQALLEADCMLAGMVELPGNDPECWALIEQEIASSDYYLMILGGDYDDATTGVPVWLADMEYDVAIERGIPIMSFLHGVDVTDTPGSQGLAHDAQEGLGRLRGKAASGGGQYFTSASELAGKATRRLLQKRRSFPALGWVRAPGAMAPDVEQELVRLRARVVELEAERTEPADGHADARANVRHQGADDSDETEAQLQLTYAYWTTSQLETGEAEDYFSFTTAGGDYSLPVMLSWDDIFAAIGPGLIVEMDEADMNVRLRKACIDRIELHRRPTDFGKTASVTLDEDSADDVRVHLFASGLIGPSQVVHPRTDTRRYWSLTAAGSQRLMRVRSRQSVPSRPMLRAVQAD